MSKLERPTEGELYIAYQLGKENKEAYAKEQVIKELERVEETFPKTFRNTQEFEEVWMKLTDKIIKLKQK